MSKFKTVYVLSEISPSENGYNHKLVGIFSHKDGAIDEKNSLEFENEGTEYVIEPWPLEH